MRISRIQDTPEKAKCVVKAVVYEKHGSPEVLEFKEIEKTSVMDDDVLAKIHAASMGPLDWNIRSGSPLWVRLMAGLMKLRILNALIKDK